jgi:FkbM family methyltransferase
MDSKPMSLRNKLRGLKEMWQFENRLPLILTRTLFPRENLHVYRYRGVELLTDLKGGDANGAREVLTSQMYRRFLPQMNLRGELNVFGFPLLLATSGLILKKVVSVELNPNTFLRLRFNLERNLTGEVVALNQALCGEARDLKIALGEGSVSDNIYNGGANGGELFVIEGRTFDDLYETYFGDEVVDVCKIDIEGAEFEVFEKPSHQNLARCRYLIMEIHDSARSTDLIRTIENLGLKHKPLPADADPAVHFFINDRYA